VAPSRRRENHRTAVVDGRARIIVPVEDLEWESRAEPRVRSLKRWFAFAEPDRPEDLCAAGAKVSVVLDGYAFTLFVTDHDAAIEFSGTHDGEVFRAAAVGAGNLDVFVTSGVDVRRSTPAALADAAASGAVRGARVDVFAVQTL